MHGAAAEGRRSPGIVAAGAVAALVADLAFDPVQRHVPLCPFRALTGWWCPLCGSLRSAYSLAHGHLGAALHDNALFVAGSPVMLALWLGWVVRGQRIAQPRSHRRPLIVAVIVVCVIFTVLRNLPAMGWLRPL